jgi:hypothetical protein
MGLHGLLREELYNGCKTSYVVGPGLDVVFFNPAGQISRQYITLSRFCVLLQPSPILFH